MDVFALLAPLGLLLGRIANFVNGELLGKVAAKPGEPSPWWAVKFPQEVSPPGAPGYESFRTAAQEQALDAIVGRFALPGEDWRGAYDRVVSAVQAGGPEGRSLASELSPLLSARYPSQLLQALAEGVILGAALWLIWARPRKPGVVGAWFLIIYGVLRVATEFVRLPDTHLEVQRVLGLSRGQWLSMLMVAIGLVALAMLRRSRAPKVGGWAANPPSPRVE
jgi:phosphatidylglycerol:prolipoprotein diacylglycerol transferase